MRALLEVTDEMVEEYVFSHGSGVLDDLTPDELEDVRAVALARAFDLLRNGSSHHDAGQDNDNDNASLVEEHAGASTAKPVDLWAGYTAPELPIGLLPAVVEEFARKQGAVMGVDPAALAMAALATSAAAISDDIVLQMKVHDPGWRESARIWVGLVGEPSSKKSPILREAIRPLRRIDNDMARSYAAKSSAYGDLEPKEKKKVERPKQERRIISDSTPEAAQEIMKDSPSGLLSYQDELSGWFGAMDKYSPGKGSQADRAFWLQSYNGGSYSANRIGRGSVYIENCSITLLGGIQPAILRKFANDSVDDGLLARLIPVIVRPGHVGRDAPADVAARDYEGLIDQLVHVKQPMRFGLPTATGSEAMTLRLDEGARTIREALETKHLAAVRALEKVSPKLASAIGKFDGLFGRLCVVWHVIEHAKRVPIPVEISNDTAERVAEFMDKFIKPSCVAFYAGQLGLAGDQDDVVALAAFIVAEGVEEVDARTVMRSAGKSFKGFNADEVRVICERLSSFGWLDEAPPKPKSNAARWRVNPAVHAAFAEQGQRERERRAAAREAIHNAFASNAPAA